MVPKYLYGSEMWGLEEQNVSSIDRIYNEFLYKLLGANKTNPK